MSGRTRALGAAVLVGAMAGGSSAAFLWTLERATELRVENPWLLWLLPPAGVAMAATYRTYGRDVAGGNRLTASEIATPHTPVPLRLAPLAFVTTVATHLFGGSAGREGTALQMSVGLADGVMGRIDSAHADRVAERRTILVAALAGGFGSVFGVPFAGVVFAMEVSPTGWGRRLAALPSAIVASFLGNAVVGWMGVSHADQPRLDGVGPVGLMKVAAAGVAFGLTAGFFVRLTDTIRERWADTRWRPEVRAALGGAAVVAATLALGTRDYNGLSLPLIGASFSLASVAAFAFLIKLVMTSVTIGSGYQGGEVTPLFVIGATLGASLTRWWDGPQNVLVGVGMMAVFGAAAGAPIACVVMGIELFGTSAAPALIVGCLIANAVSGRRHIYEPLPTLATGPIGTAR